ncbi:MAG: 3-hydroxybutyryl-CoA dehydrogenase [Sphingomonadales bacterium]|nr:3-hydroxybutyryl-CoA dehydrogenase [Sphingomonadales bacterium]
MKVAVAGAGVMGAGIALSSIQAGYQTLLFDVSETALEKGKAYIRKELEKSVEKGKTTTDKASQTLTLLTAVNKTADMKADIIIEAVLENLEIKQELFKQLETVNSPETILATNTSSIPITQIARSLQYPNRVVGVHFFNPAHIMKLVEIISGAETDCNVAQKAFEWAESLGKKAVYAADAPGFIVNRVARHYYVEGLKILEEQVANLESIDRLCEASGFKMGPFRLMDLIGVDTNYSVTSSMFSLFGNDAKFRPSRIQKQKVDAGHHGRKSGQGFYRYED